MAVEVVSEGSAGMAKALGDNLGILPLRATAFWIRMHISAVVDCRVGFLGVNKSIYTVRMVRAPLYCYLIPLVHKLGFSALAIRVSTAMALS